MVRNFFHQLYSNDCFDYRPLLLPFDRFPLLFNIEWHDLSKPFTYSELGKICFQHGCLQTPRPDGFQELFYQKIWELVGEKLLDAKLKIK